MSKAGDTLTRVDALQYLRRFPAQGAVAVAVNLALVFAGNAIVLHLLMTDRLRAAHLIALVMTETVLLIAMGWALQRLVPKRDWLEPSRPWREKGPLLAFVLVWIGGVYAITLAVLRGYPDFLALLRSPQAWLEAGLQWPLLYTFAFAIVHAGGDLAYYRRHGGPFLSSLSHDAMARYLTLLLGGVPFAMPFFVVVIGGLKGIEFVVRRARSAPGSAVLVGAAMLAVAGCGFAVIDLLVANEVAGWAIGFVLAKLIAETLVVCIPLVMAHVARNGP